MESYGANCLYVTDSAGYMLPDDVYARVALLREKAKPSTEIGFHGHHNLSMGISNSLLSTVINLLQTVLNADATLTTSGDQLTVTDTITL